MDENEIIFKEMKKWNEFKLQCVEKEAKELLGRVHEAQEGLMKCNSIEDIKKLADELGAFDTDFGSIKLI